jgi:hypothetical protein
LEIILRNRGFTRLTEVSFSPGIGQYSVLGDDVTIHGSNIAQNYVLVMSMLGVEVNVTISAIYLPTLLHDLLNKDYYSIHKPVLQVYSQLVHPLKSNKLDFLRELC